MSEELASRRLQRLEATEDIRRLKQRYAALCDSGYPPQELAALFTEDGVWDARPTFGVRRGRRAIAEMFAGTPTDVFSFHCMIDVAIDVEDDGLSARGTWRLLQMATMPLDGEPQAMWLAAMYCDEYRREADGWRFASVKIDYKVQARHLRGWADARLQI